MDGDDSSPPERVGLADLARSARGWHGVQLAVLAFIGLCGVLTDDDPAHPRWLQIGSALAALLALALACLAVFLVASVAWPFPTASTDGDDAVAGAAAGAGGDTALTGRRRLRTGVALTYAAVITMAIAASASWWPDRQEGEFGGGDGAGANVEVTAHSGGTACGELLDAPAGTVRLATASGDLTVPIARLAGIVPADFC